MAENRDFSYLVRFTYRAKTSLTQISRALPHVIQSECSKELVGSRRKKALFYRCFSYSLNFSVALSLSELPFFNFLICSTQFLLSPTYVRKTANFLSFVAFQKLFFSTNYTVEQTFQQFYLYESAECSKERSSKKYHLVFFRLRFSLNLMFFEHRRNLSTPLAGILFKFTAEK